MLPEQGIIIRVHHEWNSWRYADVPLVALEDVHWFQPVGAPRPLVHAFVSSVSVGIPQSIDHNENRRRSRVCVLREHALASVYQQLVRRSGPASVDLLGSAGDLTLGVNARVGAPGI